MASYVKTRFEVYGKKADVEKFISFISSETSDFDFNNVIPMPNELDIESGKIECLSFTYFCKKNGICNIPGRFDLYADKSLEQIEEQIRTLGKELEEYYKQGELYYQNYMKYGYTSWYNWCCDMWGTKWNASNIDYNGMYLCYRAENPENDKYVANYKFDTARTPPIRIFSAIIKKFPELEFEMVSAGESCCEATIVRGKDGELDFDAFVGKEGHKIAVEIWGYDPDEEDEEEY